MIEASGRLDYSNTLTFSDRTIDSVYEQEFTDEPIPIAGHYRYVATVSVSPFSESLDILSFDAASKDLFIAQMVYPILISVALSAIVSVVVSLLVNW